MAPSRRQTLWLAAALCACGARTSLSPFESSESNTGSGGGRSSTGTGGSPSFSGSSTTDPSPGLGGSFTGGTGGSFTGGTGGSFTGGTGGATGTGGEAGETGNGGEAGSFGDPDEVVAVSANFYGSCALSADGRVRCWGYGPFGHLGYGNEDNIGDAVTPASAGDVDVGGPVQQIAVGASHTCALLEGGKVRCWGEGDEGRLGYGNEVDIGDDELPTAVGFVELGGNAVQLAAGYSHTCALLESGKVRCWGEGYYGLLGYGNTEDIGDGETPASAGDVDVGGTVKQIGAGSLQTCALLLGGQVRCWGYGAYGSLGYGNTDDIGDNETPASAGDIDVGGTVTQLAVGDYHVCALLENGAVRCWGDGSLGRLGYGNEERVGDGETPASAGDVDVGGVVVRISAATGHSCALLATGSVRCWGHGNVGILGHVNVLHIGDNETPASAGDIDVGGVPSDIEAGGLHTCVILAGKVRCWGYGGFGRLGYGNDDDIGDNETPASAGDVPVF